MDFLDAATKEQLVWRDIIMRSRRFFFFFSFRYGQVIQYNKNGGNRERKVLASRLQAGRKCRVRGGGAELHFNYYHNVQSELNSFCFFQRG